MSVAFTYNDLVIFAEHAMNVAGVCRERDLKAVAATADCMANRTVIPAPNWMSPTST